MYENSTFTSLPTLDCIWHFDSSHHSGYKFVFECFFICFCISLMATYVEYLFMHLLEICIFFWSNIYSDSSPFLNWVICFFIMYEFFICSEYKSLLRCMIGKYFPSFYVLYFHFLDGVLWSTKVFNFDGVQLTCWIFYWSLCFGIISLSSFRFPHSSVSKESACSTGDLGSIPGFERSSGEGNGNSLQYWEIPWTEEPGEVQPMGS